MTPQQSTKIERVVEAVESLANATIGVHHARDHMRPAAMENVRDGRQELRDALADFIAPVLRVAAVRGERTNNIHPLRP